MNTLGRKDEDEAIIRHEIILMPLLYTFFLPFTMYYIFEDLFVRKKPEWEIYFEKLMKGKITQEQWNLWQRANSNEF